MMENKNIYEEQKLSLFEKLLIVFGIIGVFFTAFYTVFNYARLTIDIELPIGVFYLIAFMPFAMMFIGLFLLLSGETL